MSTDTSVLPRVLKEKKELVVLHPTATVGAKGHDAASTFDSVGFDNSFNMKDFKDKLRLQINSMDEEEMCFDLIGVDAPIANALRRILLSEVPTIALEHVYIANNTSIIPDEILAHRIGLVPVKADPAAFEFVEEGGEATFANTLVFRLDVKCTRRPDVPDDATDAEKYENESVLSSDLMWVPQGEQEQQHESDPIRTVHDSILLAKLRPGQAIELEAHAQKGIGHIHAKWSPVATASYRLLPVITLKEPIEGADADELGRMCPMNVFDVEEDEGGVARAVVARPRDCTMCRECIRQPEWEARVQVAKKRDHFIFNVESTGVYHPKDLVREALRILMTKCVDAEAALDELLSGGAAPMDNDVFADDDHGSEDIMED